MTCKCGCTNTGLANRRYFIAGLASTAFLPIAANAKLADPYTAADVTFMRMAIEEARQADFPFGAVITQDGSILHVGAIWDERTADPTAHGEMDAIRRVSPITVPPLCAAARSIRQVSRARCAWAPFYGATSAGWCSPLR